MVAAAGRVEDSSREAGRSMREVTMTTSSGECKGGKTRGFRGDGEASDSCVKLGGEMVRLLKAGLRQNHGGRDWGLNEALVSRLSARWVTLTRDIVRLHCWTENT